MKTITINVYEFDELSDGVKQKVVNNLSSINVDYEWWESTYEDAERIGLKITGFDLDRNKHATGELIWSAIDTANEIIKEHGKDCETYKTANNFIDKLRESYAEESEDLEKDFLDSLLSDYANILQKESEYLQSEEAIIETIKANEYNFTIDGKIFSK